MALLIAFVACSASWLGPYAQAHAQFHRATDPVATPASALVRQDDASAIDVNPASIGLLPTWSLVYVHAEVDRSGSWLGQGDALSFATPLLFGLSMGATVQSVRPGPRATGPASEPVDRALAGLGLAYAPSQRFSFGASARMMTASASSMDGLSGVDFGMLWHASSWLGLSVVGRDLFASRSGLGTAQLGLSSSAVFGAQLRPLGDSSLALSFDLAVAGDDRTAARGGIGLRIPQIGYASGVMEVEHLGDRDATVAFMAELSASLEGLSVGGGGMFGDGYGKSPGYYALLRVEGQAREGLHPRSRVLDLELSHLDERGMLQAAAQLDDVLHDDRISGVLLRPRDTGMGSAYAQELRLQIESLRAAGKRVVCHLEDASGAEYYACAGADAVLIDPAGSLRLLGNSADVVLLGDTLRKVGLRADFVRIGEYKSAPEQFTQHEMSEPARQDLTALLDDVHQRTLSDLARDLSTTQAHVADIMDNGPQLASSALRDHLVRKAIDENELRQAGLQVFDDHPIVDGIAPRLAEDWNAGPRIGVLVIDGAIVDGDNVDIPFLDVHLSGGRSVIRALDAMLGDPLVRAIVVRVDSPGGAVLASDQIWRAIRRAREQKPVIVSMGAVAASGGYYVASAADEIWADPSTLTGSIGIFYGKVDVVGLANKLGVGVEVFSRGRRAGAESIWRPFTPDERAALVDTIREYYRLFLERVATGRHKTPEQIDAVGRGRIFTGDAALHAGLIDHLGGLASALARARQLAHLSNDTRLEVLPKRKQGLLDYVLGDSQASAGVSALSATMPRELRATLARVVTMQRLGSASALALLPYDVTF